MDTHAIVIQPANKQSDVTNAHNTLASAAASLEL
jgi:hypothetical protein